MTFLKSAIHKKSEILSHTQIIGFFSPSSLLDKELTGKWQLLTAHLLPNLFLSRSQVLRLQVEPHRRDTERVPLLCSGHYTQEQ